MSTRIADILTRARDSLADPKKERWSDDRLLRLLDEGQKDFARQCKLLKTTSLQLVMPNQAEFTLPSDCWLITRVQYADKAITLMSHEALDIEDSAWYTKTASAPTSLVFDRRMPETIRMYPIPDDSATEASYSFSNAGYLDQVMYTGDVFGILISTEDQLGTIIDEHGITTGIDFVDYIVTDVNSCNGIQLVTDGQFSSEYGVFTDIVDNIRVVGFHGNAQLGVVVGIDDFTLSSPYGVVTDLYSPDINIENFYSPYGVVTNIAESAGLLQIFYIRDPKPVQYIEDELEIGSRWDTAMKYFIVGHAFRDDLDTQYRTLGNEMLAFYDRELTLAKKSDSTDSTRATQFEIRYKGAF